MKITVINPTVNFSGGIRVVAIYADQLQKRGHEVQLISVPNFTPTITQQVKSLLKGKGLISKPKYPPSHFDNISVPHYVIDHRPPVVDQDVPDADVVIATWWETAEWVANLSPSKGAKAYFIQHHEIHDYLPKQRASATYQLPLHKITIAKWLVNVMREQYGDQNVSLVPNAVDLKQFNAPPRQKQSVPTVGLLYATVPWKGCDISLQAFHLARRKIPHLKLIAFGTKQPSSSLPLPPETEFYHQPPQSEIKMIYAACDAWLFASRSEGFGLPILEAMACRTPVIGTPAGAAPELISQGGGILVNPESPEEMASAIAQICQMSESEWKKMSEAAYQTATRYTWDEATDLFEQALYRAIERD